MILLSVCSGFTADRNIPVPVAAILFLFGRGLIASIVNWLLAYIAAWKRKAHRLFRTNPAIIIVSRIINSQKSSLP